MPCSVQKSGESESSQVYAKSLIGVRLTQCFTTGYLVRMHVAWSELSDDGTAIPSRYWAQAAFIIRSGVESPEALLWQSRCISVSIIR